MCTRRRISFSLFLVLRRSRSRSLFSRFFLLLLFLLALFLYYYPSPLVRFFSPSIALVAFYSSSTYVYILLLHSSILYPRSPTILHRLCRQNALGVFLGRRKARLSLDWGNRWGPRVKIDRNQCGLSTWKLTDWLVRLWLECLLKWPISIFVKCLVNFFLPSPKVKLSFIRFSLNYFPYIQSLSIY